MVGTLGIEPRPAGYQPTGQHHIPHVPLVDAAGIEPTTSSVSRKRSTAEPSVRGGLGPNRTGVPAASTQCYSISATRPWKPEYRRPLFRVGAAPGCRSLRVRHIRPIWSPDATLHGAVAGCRTQQSVGTKDASALAATAWLGEKGSNLRALGSKPSYGASTVPPNGVSEASRTPIVSLEN